LGVGLGQQVLVPRLLGHLIAKSSIPEPRHDIPQRLDLGLEALEFGQHFLGLRLVIPETCLTHSRLKLLESLDLAIVVKRVADRQIRASKSAITG